MRRLLCLVLAASLLHVSLQGEFQRKLYKDLVKNYNPLERPVANDSQPLTVYFSLSLLQIMDVDEKNQVLTTNIWLQMPGWLTDPSPVSSADERFDATFHTNVLVNSSGYCQYLPPGIFKSSCYIDVRWFPFDVQQCKLKFGSWSYGGWSLDLQMQEADISGYIPNGEWDLVGIPGKRSEKFYECCKEPYPDVTFTVTIRRRTLYYGLNLLIPCVLISALALLVFLLPADSGEKISLGITVLLSLTVFMLLVAEIMPATSDSVPLIGKQASSSSKNMGLESAWDFAAQAGSRNVSRRRLEGCMAPLFCSQYFASTMIIVGLSVVVTVIVLQYHHHDPDGGKMPKPQVSPASALSAAQYFASTMIIVGLSVVVTVIVLQYHHHDPDGGKMPKWTRVILLNWCAWFLRMKRPGEDKVRPACQHKQRRCSLASVEMSAVAGPPATNGNLLYIGFRGLDSVHCAPTPDSGVVCGRVACSPTHDEHLLHCGQPSEGDPDLAKILEEVRYIAHRFRCQDESEAVCSEWKFAACVVDRLCLMAFSVFTILCTIGILMSAPNFVEAVSKDFA
ncbi:hypothetical protein EI555_007420 [Monodon monoceros]|uniref:Neuronal acetylcholine receptor subunit alpha-7 n=1 Tax=Monodon monoceros TaxID=40151 RepID=A0A4U1EL19_MONMO|nr:hypothetical protein EI555_007420 [Monodon monoceros]